MSISRFLKSKRVRWTATGLGAALLLAVVAVYAATTWTLTHRRDVTPPLMRFVGKASVEEGERLSKVFSCRGCHGKHGGVLFEAPFVGRFVSPDLSRVTASYSDAEIATLLRTGVKRDGTSAIIMPSDAFSALSDADIAHLTAWLRSLKPEAETEKQTTSIGPIGRVMTLMGALPISASMPRVRVPPVERPAAALEQGAYFAKVACTHCHEFEKEREAEPGLFAPPLRPAAQAYDLAQFKRLLRTGKAVGDRELKMMSGAARAGFSHMTDTEIEALHAFLNQQDASQDGTQN